MGEEFPKRYRPAAAQPDITKYLTSAVPDKSCSSEFETEDWKELCRRYNEISKAPPSPSETSSKTKISVRKHSTEGDLSRNNSSNLPTVAGGGEGTTQLSPLAKRLTISSADEIPKSIPEPFKQRFFRSEVSNISCTSDTSIKSSELAHEAFYDKAVTSSEERSQTKGKSIYSASSRRNDTAPLQNKIESVNFPPAVTEYLNELINNTFHFQDEMYSFLEHHAQDIRDANSQSIYVENSSQIENFTDCSCSLSQEVLAEMGNLQNKQNFQKVLLQKSKKISYLIKKCLQLSLYNEHSLIWLEKVKQQIFENLKLIDALTSLEAQSVTIGSVEKGKGSRLCSQNESINKKLVVDSSTMTSLILSEASSQEKGKISTGSSSNETCVSHIENKIVDVLTIGTMTESTNKPKHCSAQNSDRKTSSMESDTKSSHSTIRSLDEGKKTCDASAINRSSKRNITPKSTSSSVIELSGCNVVHLHSYDVKNQTVKLFNTGTTTDGLVGKNNCKKRKPELSTYIEVNQSVATSCCPHGKNSNHHTTGTMTEDTSTNEKDFETILDLTLNSLFENSDTSGESSCTEGFENDRKSGQTTEEKQLEIQSLASEKSKRNSNFSADSLSNVQQAQLSTNLCADSSSNVQQAQLSPNMCANSSSKDEKAQLSPNIFEDLEQNDIISSASSTHSQKLVSKRTEPEAPGCKKNLKHLKKGNSECCQCCVHNKHDSRMRKKEDTPSSSAFHGKIIVDGVSHDESVNIEMYGLTSKDLSAATVDYLTRHGLVHPRSKRSSKHGKK